MRPVRSRNDTVTARRAHPVGQREVNMRRFSILCTAMVTAVTVTGFSGSAYAIKTFAQKYKMKCEGCHSVVPKLNEFGEAFMAEGFVLPGQKKPEKQVETSPAQEERAQGTAVRKSDAGLRGAETQGGNQGTASADNASGAGRLEAAEEDVAVPAPAEMIPTVVYKMPSQDGSIYYTDNPARRGSVLLGQDSDVGTSAEASSRTLLPPSKKAAGRVGPILQPATRETMAAEKKPETFRNYSECMERQLEGSSLPQDAQEIMDLFGAAEKKCAPYQARK